MACSIQFVRLDDFINDIDVLDLSTDGYSLAVDGYFPMAAPIGAKSVHEVITLKLQGSSKNDLAAMTQEIDEKIKQVQWWIDAPGVERYQVWLRVQLENETYPRQAQILNIQPPDKIRLFTPEERIDNYIGSYSLGIERTPFWEPLNAPNQAATTISGIDTIGGIGTVVPTINGDVPARLSKTIITVPDANNYQGEWWIGWKSSRLGNAANFVSVWSLRLSQYLNAASGVTSVADATAYDGNKLQCTFADATLVTRSITLVSDVVSDSAKYLDQRGSYSVLLRAKLSGSGQARARLLYSFGDGTLMFSPIYRSRVLISGTNWAFYDMGTVVIPSLRIYAGNSLGNAAIAIQAERISGASNLDLDCLVLIPNAEGSIHLTTVGGVNMIVGQGNVNIFQAPDETISAYPDRTVGGLVEVYFSMTYQSNRWGLPLTTGGSSIVVFSGQQIGGNDTRISTKGKTSNLSFLYVPRWRTLRGNST